MGLNIEDGAGSGKLVAVNAKQELKVRSTNHPLQHAISEDDGEAYQVVGDFATINNATHTILHIVNDSADKNLYVTYIRLQTVDLAGGTALPSALTYWQVGTGRTVSAGGTEVTPVNVNFASPNTADATCTDNNPTMTGTFTEIDRYYPQSEADSIVYNKEAAVMLGKGEVLEIRIVTDHTSGTGYARVSCFFEKADD